MVSLNSQFERKQICEKYMTIIVKKTAIFCQVLHI